VTEQEWSKTAPALGQMLYHLADSSSERKLRLFLHACCCRIQHALTDDRSRKALAELERLIEGRPGHWDLETLQSLAKEASDAVEAPLYVDGILRANSESYAANAVLCATSSDLGTTRMKEYSLSSLTSAAHYARGVFAGEVYRRTRNREQAEAADAAEAAVQVALLRDIFGNPFRPVKLKPAWLTSTVVQLARGIYEERAFDRMPILADALQDAGCDNDDVLDHCRDAKQVHVRGCWVVDLVLGKS
jgi:hypothetical protein